MLDLPRNLFKHSDNKPKVLIVEDEKPLREAFSFLLSSEHYPFDAAENGSIALKKLKIFKPDIILLDLLMPVMDGMEFLRKAHLKEAHPSCKVIIMSNLSDLIRLRDVAHLNVKQVVIKANLAPTDLLKSIQKLS